MPCVKFTGTIAIACLCALIGSSQSGPERLRFEIASVKPNKDNQGGSIVRTPGGLTATNAEFSRLLEMAFQTRLIDLSRVPDSLRSERFDIIAKAAGKISGDQYWQMLQTLFEDRFQLHYHHETRQAQIYALVLANKEKGLGPQMSPSTDADCPVNPNGSNFCGVSARPGLMVGQRVSMSRIARELSAFAGRPVENQTGMTGAFDFQLTWTPDEFRSEDGRPKTLNGIPMDSAGPSFFPAVREQLGLQLESQKGQIDMLVIDAAQQPSEN
jgi:uncharacterized protein (TIGR03435 family)